MTATSQHAETTVLALDASVDTLATDADVEGLKAVLAEDFLYTHSTGATQTREVWIESLIPLAGKRQRVVSNVAVEIHGDIAVARGDLDIVWNDGRLATNRYVRVFRLRDGHWQAISQRTLPAPDRLNQGSYTGPATP